MVATRTLLALALSAIMVTSAGCAGWGIDDPGDPEEGTDGNGEAQADEDPEDDVEVTDDPTSEEAEEDDEDPTEYDGTDPPDADAEAESDADAEAGAGADVPDEQPDETGAEGPSESDGSEGVNDADDGETADDEEPVYTLTVEATSPVTLERTWEDASTTREPTDGTVEFSVIEGSYTLSAEGYHDVPEELAIHVDSDTTVTLQNEDGGEIEVRVVDAETGEGIEGAEISGVCNWYYSAGDVYVTGETDADGVANAHAGLAPTDCDATVSAEGYESEGVSLSVPDDDGTTIELEPEEFETNTLTVEVTDAETGEPIEGAAVEAHGADGDPEDTRDLHYEAKTDENGVAEMEVRAAMNYVITVEAAGYETGHGEVSLDREASIELTPEETGEISVVDWNIDQEGHDTGSEWILFRNAGDGTLDLTDWMVEDSSRVNSGNLNPFQFPSMTLEPGEEVRLITGDGENTDDTVYWGIDNAVWDRDGDTVIVRDSTGEDVLEQDITPENEDNAGDQEPSEDRNVESPSNGDEEDEGEPPSENSKESSENDNDGEIDGNESLNPIQLSS